MRRARLTRTLRTASARPIASEISEYGLSSLKHIEFSVLIISTGCSGDLAYTVGRYESTNAGEKSVGVNVVVVKKINGRRLIVAHEFAVPDPATAIPHLDIPSEH